MKKNDGKILVVDDDQDVLATAKMFLKQEFVHVQIENNPAEIIKHLERENFDLVLLDMNFKKGESDGSAGMKHLNQILNFNPSIVVIPMTAYGEIDLAVQAVKAGATDFISKPWKNEKLLATINSGIRLRKSSLENVKLKETQQVLVNDIGNQNDAFLGDSPAMQNVFNTIEKVAPTDASILILGENGTGKELAARALHQQSGRKEKVFIRVDLGALSETLFESEIFGHVKGAFTDAKESKAGRFEVADGGTIFLDEIGNLSLALQAKLLTILQNQKVTRVGSSKEIAVDVRVIAATNMDLYQMVNQGTFRQDLLYRINTVELQIPALRDRSSDIPILTRHFLKVFGKKYHKPNMRIDKSLMAKLEKSQWAGNIRELQHAIERAVILSDDQNIDASSFLIQETQGGAEQTDSLDLKENERRLILKALEKHSGNITRAAKELGIDRLALYRRMEKYGL